MMIIRKPRRLLRSVKNRQLLGLVEAADRQAAAAKQFDLSDEERSRLVVQKRG